MHLQTHLACREGGVVRGLFIEAVREMVQIKLKSRSYAWSPLVQVSRWGMLLCSGSDIVRLGVMQGLVLRPHQRLTCTAG